MQHNSSFTSLPLHNDNGWMVDRFISILLVLIDRAIQRSHCIIQSSDGENQCNISSIPYTICFGAVQIFFSQIPDFHNMWWLSIVASVMSFTYSIIGLVLGVTKIAGYIPTSLWCKFSFNSWMTFYWHITPAIIGLLQKTSYGSKFVVRLLNLL